MAQDESTLPELRVGEKVDGEWPVFLDDVEMEGSRQDKIDHLGKLMAEDDGEPFIKENSPWYHEGEFCDACADGRIAMIYLDQEYASGTKIDGPEFLEGLGYESDLASRIFSQFQFGVMLMELGL